jgi:tellurite resistance protein TerC
MNVSLWVWILAIGLTSVFLLVDVLVIGRRPHVPSMGEAARHLAFYVTLAVMFGLGVWHFSGADFAAQYFAGWVTEYSLSVDNLFVFLIIMAKFGVPEKLQQTALMVGIVIALILRGIFIGVGAAAINEFSWIFYVFGAFLVFTAVNLAREGESDDDEYEENRFLKWVESRFPATNQWYGTKLFITSNGSRSITPMFIVILALGTTDLLFALDSIPAIFGLTQEPFLVLTANIFALMGLRQLYFLIGGLLKRLVYLGIGLAVLLSFIGVKLILHAAHVNELPFINGGHPVRGAPDISIGQSLTVIIGILAITTITSLLKSRKDDNREDDATFTVG